MSILHIAEKNSIAKQVANVLSRLTKRTVFTNSQYNPVYQFELQSQKHHFSSVRGHIFSHELPEECKFWSSYDNRKILFQNLPIVKILGPQMEDVVKNLERLAREHVELILWLDCDRQGEAISFQVIEIIKKINPRIKIKRARFAAVTPTDVWNAYNGLVQPNIRQADAVSYRTQIDFRAGCAFTRLQTVVFQEYFQSSEKLTLSYGPCQIPTLSFVVQRYLEIKNFKPEKYWLLQMICVINDNVGIPFHWEKQNTRNETEAHQAISRILRNPTGQVYGTVKGRKKIDRKRARPYPLTTVKYQKIATDKLRMSSAQAMQIAQKLYQKGLISYPRTETNTFPKTMNLKELLKRLENSNQYGTYVNKLLDQNRYVHPKAGNQNDQAHTPIHPVKMVERNSLTAEEWKVYDLICRSFLACCSSDATGEQFEVKADVMGEGFKASYLTVKDEGFLQIYPFQKWVQTSFPADIPDKFLAMISLKDKKTTPPGYLTEANLIDLMQKNQIGTDSTIHEHIENIQKRMYAVKYNNTLKPTNLGASLVQAYQQLEVVLPKCDIRRKMEQKMNMIARGELNKDVATQETLDEMVPIFDKLKSVKQQWVRTLKKFIESNSELKKIEIQEKSENEIQNQNRKATIIIGRCLKCQENANLRFSQKNQSYFIGCSKYLQSACKWAQSLPAYIQSIQQCQTVCEKCQNKKFTIKAKQGRSIDPFMMKIRFQESEDNMLQICLALRCDEDMSESIDNASAFSFSNQNQNSNSNFPSSQTNNNFNRSFNTTSNFRQNNRSFDNENTTSNYRSNYSNDNNEFQNGDRSRSTNTNWQNRQKKQIKCYHCNQVGHIVPNCPNKNNNGPSNNSRQNNFKNGQFNQNKFKKQEKNNSHSRDRNEGNSQKVCPECGAQGRHPRGSNCPTVVKKRKNKEDNNN